MEETQEKLGGKAAEAVIQSLQSPFHLWYIGIAISVVGFGLIVYKILAFTNGLPTTDLNNGRTNRTKNSISQLKRLKFMNISDLPNNDIRISVQGSIILSPSARDFKSVSRT